MSTKKKKKKQEIFDLPLLGDLSSSGQAEYLDRNSQIADVHPCLRGTNETTKTATNYATPLLHGGITSTRILSIPISRELILHWDDLCKFRFMYFYSL